MLSLRELAIAPSGDPLDSDKHAACPGHLAWIGSDWRGARVDYGCDQWRAQGHHDRAAATGRPTMDDTEKAQRSETIENNKAWRAAETVRREWLTVLCTRRTPPKGAATYVARELLTGGHELRRAMERPTLLSALLGLGDSAAGKDVAAVAENVTDGRAQVLSLTAILAAHEQATGVHSWRSVHPATAAYLSFLADLGYELAPIERKAAGLSASRRRKTQAA